MSVAKIALLAFGMTLLQARRKHVASSFDLRPVVGPRLLEVSPREVHRLVAPNAILVKMKQPSPSTTSTEMPAPEVHGQEAAVEETKADGMQKQKVHAVRGMQEVLVQGAVPTAANSRMAKQAQEQLHGAISLPAPVEKGGALTKQEVWEHVQDHQQDNQLELQKDFRPSEPSLVRVEGSISELSKLMEQEECQQLFLLDGRLPAHLPRTWAEARKSFEDICEELGRESTWCNAKGQETFRDTAQRAAFLCAELWSFLHADDFGLLVEKQARARGAKRSQRGTGGGDDLRWLKISIGIFGFLFAGYIIYEVAK